MLFHIVLINYYSDLEVGEERIVPEDIGFKEPEFVCEPGSVIRGKTCGKMISLALYSQNLIFLNSFLDLT